MINDFDLDILLKKSSLALRTDVQQSNLNDNTKTDLNNNEVSKIQAGTANQLLDPLGGLVLDPPIELLFKGPFDDYVAVSLMVRNSAATNIAFKVLTTAPKRYCVKPNSGLLGPGEIMKTNGMLLYILVYYVSKIYLREKILN